MAKFNSITEQLKSKECRTVLGVAVAARSKAHRRWKDINMAVTDAANESKDNVKYLTTLEKPLEPLYVGTPQAIVDGLPVLLNSVKMMHTVARYYATPERMTTLFRKISNQLVTRCSEFVGEGGNLWNQNRPALLDKMRLCVKMEKRYKEEYAASKERLAQQPKGGSLISTTSGSSSSLSSSSSAATSSSTCTARSCSSRRWRRTRTSTAWAT